MKESKLTERLENLASKLEASAERLESLLKNRMDFPLADEEYIKKFYDKEYADINGIFLKRENETLRYCEHFAQEEALRLFEDSEKRLPAKEEWDRMLEPGITWDTEKKGIWIGRSHELMRETGHSTFLPAAGCRYISVGELYYRGSYGYYWSSTVHGSNNGRHVYFSSGYRDAKSNLRSQGFSVRCIKR
jgi:uncharacterized protein (TIGR02145 family)